LEKVTRKEKGKWTI